MTSSSLLTQIHDEFINLAECGQWAHLQAYYLQYKDKGLNVHHRNDLALKMAAKKRHFLVVRWLIEELHCNIHACSGSRDQLSLIPKPDACIAHACANNDLSMLEYLLIAHHQHQGQTKLCDTIIGTMSCLANSIGSGHIDIVECLLKHGERLTECESPMDYICKSTPLESLIPLMQLLLRPHEQELSLPQVPYPQQKPEWWTQAMCHGIQHSSLKVMKWVWTNIPHDYRERLDRDSMLQLALDPDGFDIILIKFLIQVVGAKFTETATQDVLTERHYNPLNGVIIDMSGWLKDLATLGLDLSMPHLLHNAKIQSQHWATIGLLKTHHDGDDFTAKRCRTHDG
jgi:hypothetical protein